MDMFESLYEQLKDVMPLTKEQKESYIGVKPWKKMKEGKVANIDKESDDKIIQTLTEKKGEKFEVDDKMFEKLLGEVPELRKYDPAEVKKGLMDEQKHMDILEKPETVAKFVAQELAEIPIYYSMMEDAKVRYQAEQAEKPAEAPVEEPKDEVPAEEEPKEEVVEPVEEPKEEIVDEIPEAKKLDNDAELKESKTLTETLVKDSVAEIEAIATKAGLSGEDLSKFVAFMTERFGSSFFDPSYASEWAKRFINGPYAYADGLSTEVLKKVGVEESKVNEEKEEKLNAHLDPNVEAAKEEVKVGEEAVADISKGLQDKAKEDAKATEKSDKAAMEGKVANIDKASDDEVIKTLTEATYEEVSFDNEAAANDMAKKYNAKVEKNADGKFIVKIPVEKK